jgi:GLPGLI family protein
VVWFAPSIPTSQGPENFSGLPGLILEVISEKKLISCTKLSLLPPGKYPIKPPVKGVKLSQKQFDALTQKK